MFTSFVVKFTFFCHTGSRDRQSVQLERVGRVAMGGLLLQVAWQIDDGYGVKGTLLDADAAADAQLLRDGRDPIVGRDLDAKFAHADN